jgi:O-antigen ligase
VRHWRQFAWFAMCLGFLVAVFGIIQDFTFNGKLYWIRPLQHGGQNVVFGPFVNRNHFAGCMELLVPMGLGVLTMRGVRKQQLPLAALFTIVPIGALVLSASRGGFIAIIAEFALLVGIVAFAGGKRRLLLILTTIGVLGLALGLIAWLGFGAMMSRFEGPSGGIDVSMARRMALKRDAWRIFLDYPVIGTGLGTTISVFPRYETAYDGYVIDHIHDDNLEWLLETGAIGGVFWLAFLGCIAWFGYKGITDPGIPPPVTAVHLGALLGCAGIFVHSFLDFNLHIPSNALIFYIWGVMATAAPENSHQLRTTSRQQI